MSDCNCKTPPTAAKETDHYADIQNSLRGVREKLVRGKAVEAAITEAHKVLDASGLLGKRDITHRGIVDRVRDLVDRVFAANTESEALRKLQTNHVHKVEELILKIQQLERMQPPTPPIPEANEYYQGVIVGQVKQMEQLQKEGYIQAQEIAILRQIIQKLEGKDTSTDAIARQQIEIRQLQKDNAELQTAVYLAQQGRSIYRARLDLARQALDRLRGSNHRAKLIEERGLANRLATLVRAVVYGHVHVLNTKQALELLNEFDAARRAQESKED